MGGGKAAGLYVLGAQSFRRTEDAGDEHGTHWPRLGALGLFKDLQRTHSREPKASVHTRSPVARGAGLEEVVDGTAEDVSSCANLPMAAMAQA